MSENILPTALWVEARLRKLEQDFVPHYYLQKGNYASGLVMVKSDGLKGFCRLYTQQRNFMSGELEWIDALDQEIIEYEKADAYIQRAIKSDPDLWAIEIEDKEMKNPFID